MSVSPFDSLTVTFEVSWTTNPYASPSYTDESAYMRSWSVRRGRASQFDQFPAGTMTVELENSTRRFDPLYTAGALYPNVLPRKKCRLSLTYAAVTYRIFTGFIDSVDQEGEQSNTLGTAVISATDGFKMLSRTSTPVNPGVFLNVGGTVSSVIGTLLDLAGWPAADRDLDTDSPTTRGVDQLGTPILPLLYQFGMSDFGQVFVAGDGDLTYRGHRWGLTNALTSTATIGDGAGEVPYSAVDFSYNDTLIFNRVLGAYYAGGTGQGTLTQLEVTNAASTAAFGEAANDIGTSTAVNGNVVQNTIEWVLAYYKDAKVRVDHVEFNPRRSPTTIFPVVLAATIGARWTFARRPQNVGTAISQDVIVEGLTYSMTPDSFTAGFDLSQAPAPAAGQTYWRMGVSTWGTSTYWA